MCQMKVPFTVKSRFKPLCPFSLAHRVDRLEDFLFWAETWFPLISVVIEMDLSSFGLFASHLSRTSFHATSPFRFSFPHPIHGRACCFSLPFLQHEWPRKDLGLFHCFTDWLLKLKNSSTLPPHTHNPESWRIRNLSPLAEETWRRL